MRLVVRLMQAAEPAVAVGHMQAAALEAAGELALVQDQDCRVRRHGQVHAEILRARHHKTAEIDIPTRALRTILLTAVEELVHSAISRRIMKPETQRQAQERTQTLGRMQCAARYIPAQ